MDAVIPLVYGELKKLDGGRLRREGGAKPLETTALVHEAFPRLVGRAQPYLGGMTAEESASANSISVHLVRRELRLAQAWLTKELAT